MIHSLKIEGYRGFERFAMSGLGRINLLVGTNDSGKTSVLEALYLLAAGGDPFALWQIVSRRGERLEEDVAVRRPELEMDVSHLFHGHDLKPSSTFSVSAKNQTPERAVTYTVGEVSRKDAAADDGPPGTRLAIYVKGTPVPSVVMIPLSRGGGITSDSLTGSRRRRRETSEGEMNPAQYISTESLSMEELSRMWGRVVLTDAETRVLRALKFLDDKIERIAVVTSGPSPYYFTAARGGFIVKRTGQQPIPIGSMGDGMWRMLAMAIALSRSKGGVLLIDEIDTGLHYTVLVNMWKLVAETAKELDIQIFATTHSYDCVKSLAEICQADVDTNSQVTIQRIEPEHGKSVPYTESEIRVAAERHIEVR